ncbi:hypothetical protein [Halobaculum sp. MBLA0143]|uniref:hypothetical protein n=1 Tax=Halobaculum sp. MBLA0143 TaxID=3079933 RepID=UPI003523BC9A
MRKSTKQAAKLYGVALLVVTAGFAIGLATAPNISTNNVAESDQRNIVGVQQSGEIHITTQSGERIWSYGNASAYFDVDSVDESSVLAAFTKKSQKCGDFDAPCTRTGFRIIDTGSSEITHQWTYPVRDEFNSEVHDADLLPSGNVILADMEYERILIVNPKSESVVWRWNASSYYTRPPNPTRTDWLHINDVDRVGPDRYMVSVRNKDQILMINRNKTVVEVINKDRDHSILWRQHNPQWLNNDTVLVADSENNRIVELKNSDGQWNVSWSLTSAGGVPLDWPRDADRLENGNTLIMDTNNNRVVEVSREGDVVASYTTGNFPYEVDRLPGDENLGGPSMRQQSVTSGSEIDHVPVLTRLVEWSRPVLPLPFWVGEIQSFSVLVGILLVVVGTERLLQPLSAPLLGHTVELRARGKSILEVLEAQTTVGEILLGIYIVLFSITSGSQTGIKLGVGMALLVDGWRRTRGRIRIANKKFNLPETTTLIGNVVISSAAVVASLAILYTGVVFPGSLLLDLGISTLLMTLSISVLNSNQ